MFLCGKYLVKLMISYFYLILTVTAEPEIHDKEVVKITAVSIHSALKTALQILCKQLVERSKKQPEIHPCKGL